MRAEVHGKKHIARMERRAAALDARFLASPDQADFDDERAELKSLRWAIDQLRDAAPAPVDGLVDIDALVNRFLCWSLPTDFAPDCGITFRPVNHENSWPVGTNLFTASQAREMFGNLLDGGATSNAPSIAEHLFVDQRGDGIWLVCVEKVHKSLPDAQAACRKWIDRYAVRHAAAALQSRDEGEPVAWLMEWHTGDGLYRCKLDFTLESAESLEPFQPTMTPLYAHPPMPDSLPDATVESIMRQVDIVVANTQKLTEAGLNVQFAQGAYKELERQIDVALRAHMGRKG